MNAVEETRAQYTNGGIIGIIEQKKRYNKSWWSGGHSEAFQPTTGDFEKKSLTKNDIRRQVQEKYGIEIKSTRELNKILEEMGFIRRLSNGAV